MSKNTNHSLGMLNDPSIKNNAVKATRVFMWRTMQHMKNKIFGDMIEAVIGPVILLLIFSYLFGGAIAGSAEVYIQYLLPGILILAIVPMTVYSGTTLCTDISKGVYSRFRTMPFWQPAAVLGPLITDGLRYAVTLLSALAAGMLLGFLPEGGLAGTILALLFIMAFGFSMSWIFSAIGIIVKRPESVSGISMIFIYPLLFASNILVDSSTMPVWLQALIDLNPISIAADAVRSLMSGATGTTEVFSGIAVCILITIVFAPLTVYLYLTKHNR